MASILSSKKEARLSKSRRRLRLLGEKGQEKNGKDFK